MRVEYTGSWYAYAYCILLSIQNTCIIQTYYLGSQRLNYRIRLPFKVDLDIRIYRKICYLPLLWRHGAIFFIFYAFILFHGLFKNSLHSSRTVIIKLMSYILPWKWPKLAGQPKVGSLSRGGGGGLGDRLLGKRGEGAGYGIMRGRGRNLNYCYGGNGREGF